MKTCFIYALVDPRDFEVRYVGKADNLKKRLQAHLNDKSSIRKARWLHALAEDRLMPIVTILEANCENWQESERRWIRFFRDSGCDLTNHTDGGEGLCNPTPETRAKISLCVKARMSDPAHREKIFTPERSQKISRALRGLPKSAEHIAKLPQNQSGRVLNAEQRARISQGLRGNQNLKGFRHSDETKNLIAAKLKGNQHTSGLKMSVEEKIKRSRALKGKSKSPEHREKIRQAQLKAWVRRKEKTNVSQELYESVGSDAANGTVAGHESAKE